MITVGVTDPITGFYATVMFVYASNLQIERRILWADIISTARYPIVSSRPLLVVGDFNQILTASEHFSTVTTTLPLSGMNELRDCLNQSELSDLPFRGVFHTWTNNGRSVFRSRKLDRALVNEAWFLAIPRASAYFDSPGSSDHSPCLVSFPWTPRIRPKTFRYFNFLSTHPNFLANIETSWNDSSIVGCRMFTFAGRLRAAKNCCKLLNKESFGKIKDRTDQAFQVLLRAQRTLLSYPGQMNQQEEIKARDSWLLLDSALESYYRQKSRIQWLKAGDANTTFFHRWAASNAQRNEILCLRSEDGSIVTDTTTIKEMVVSFFQNLLGTTNPAVFPPSIEYLRSIHPFRCQEPLRQALTFIPSPASIVATIARMPSNKAPGPDGFPIDFYRSAWSVIGRDTTNAVVEFFRSGKILKQLNATAITLIPKIPGADKLQDFRPISCCNHFYKIISSILAGRLRIFLPQVVQHNQVAFVKGRQLCENVLLASELIDGFQRTGPITRGFMKIDLTKAFDNLHWDFVIGLLRAFDLPPLFIGWIRECISTPSYSINLNGDLAGYFQGRKGLRQGDPISSLLFVLAMDVLSKRLDSAVRSGRIGLHPSCENPVISHLSFADDLLIFFDGSRSSLEAILSILDDFFRMSGLGINLLKSTLYLDGNDTAALHSLAETHGLSPGSLPVKYLGVPLSPQKLKPSDFQPLIDRVQQRFSIWKARHLSFAGRLQLLQSVISSIINFWCSIFILPNTCLAHIERLCNAFLWSGHTDNAKRAKVSWDSVCTPKIAGGLGLRRLALWNSVLGLKLIWLLFTNSGSLWVSWIKAHRLRHNTFWECNSTNTNGSWIWRKLLALKEKARAFLFCHIGTGTSVSFWHDNWTGLGSLLSLVGTHAILLTGIPISSTVSEAINNGQWRISQRSRNPIIIFLRDALPDPAFALHSDRQDTFSWTAGIQSFDMDAPTRSFSAANTFFDLAPSPPPEVSWHKGVWFSGRIPKHAFHSWIIARDRLPTRDKLRTFLPNIPSTCLLCSTEPETRDHLFFHCSYSSHIISRVLHMSPPHITFLAVLQWLPSATASRHLRVIGHLLVQASAYSLWRERNNRIHNDTSHPPLALIRDINITVKAKLASLSSPASSDRESLMEVWFGLQDGTPRCSFH